MYKRSLIWVMVISFSLLMTTSATAQTLSEKLKYNIGIGVRSGPAFFTQDLSEDLDADAEPFLVSGEILYVQSDVFSLGVNVEYHEHDVDSASLARTLGTVKTLSIIPFAEFRPLGFKKLSPYGLFGLSFNLNSFSFKTGACVFPCLRVYEPDDNLGAKFGAGLDYFATDSMSLNVELGWKVNSGDAEGGTQSARITEDFNANVLTLLLGVRFYFF